MSRTLQEPLLKTERFAMAAQLLFAKLWEPMHISALSDSTVEVQRGILKYLAEHPLAKDTAEGIVQWWLPDMRQPPGAIDVQRALDALVLQGWVAETKRSPSSTLYGLEESRLEEIREFLNS